MTCTKISTDADVQRAVSFNPNVKNELSECSEIAERTRPSGNDQFFSFFVNDAYS